MGHALAALSRNLIPIIICFILTACNGSYTAFESDVNFDNDVKTADIRQDNAELITLAAYQSAFLGHSQSAAYLFLDASDLPVGADPISLPEVTDPSLINDQFRESICFNGGSAIYSYSRSSGEAHKVGDRISIVYEGCVDENMTEYNGSMSGAYTKIKGLNDRFVVTNTEQCMAKLQDNLNINELSIDDITYDSDQNYFIVNNDSSRIIYPGENVDLNSSRVVSVPGDDISFERVGSRLKVDILSTKTVITTDLSFYVANNQNIIFILRPKEPTDEMITSIDGDQFYSVVGLEDKKENCQGFERTLSVKFKDFSTTKSDYLMTTLNGSVTLLEAQNTPNRVNHSFIDSDFTTTVTQGNSTEVYSMKDYNVEKALNIANNAYSYAFNGFVKTTNLLGGQVALTTTGRLSGSFSNLYPSAGVFEIKAKGLERIYMVPDNSKIQLRVDYNGDSTGNGFSDFDIFINSTWSELFAREFKE